MYMSDRNECSSEMAKIVVAVLALCTVTAQCHKLIETGGPYRVKRSPHYHIDDNNIPSPSSGFSHPPLPPTLAYRTRNWSGVARTTDGTQQGVFSGAAAAAENGPQISGEALALASSSTGSNIPNGEEQSSVKGKSTVNAESATGYNNGNLEQQMIKTGGGYKESQQAFQSSSSNHYGDQGGYAGYSKYGSSDKYQGQSGGFRSTLRSDAQTKSLGTNGGISTGIEYGNSGGRFSSERDEQDSLQQQHFGKINSNSQFGIKTGGTSGPEINSESYNSKKYGGSSHYHAVESNENESSEQHSTDRGQWQNGYGRKENSNHNAEHSDGSSGSSQDTQAALGSALQLATQGLKTAQETGQMGCSTCGKGGYALSNAKSHSGSAVALSIGG